MSGLDSEQVSENRARLGLALIAAGTLLAEVTLTRLFSIGLFHHFAFLVVSTALLGTGFAGVLVSVGRGRWHPGHCALTFALALPICFSLCQWLEPEPLLTTGSAASALTGMAVYALLGVPFFLGGLSVARLLTARAEQAPKLYAADLIGAAAGSFLALAALSQVGGRGALLWAAALAALGGAALSGPRASAAGVALALLLGVGGLQGNRLLPLHITRAKVTRAGVPFSKVLADPQMTRASEENMIGRVDLVDFGRFGQRLMIDAGAAAVRVPQGRPSVSDATLAYELRPQGSALILGAGAGWEVEEALHTGMKRVDAVELNPLIAKRAPEALRQDPRVRWIVDEARSVLERTERRYDAITMIHTISNAATAAGAMQLSEDYLLTVEALRALLDRLSDRGLLFMTRPEAQLPRLLISLREAGGEHFFAWAERSAGPSFYSAVIVSKGGFSSEELAAITARIKSRKRLRFLIAPQALPPDPLYAGIVSGRSLDQLQAMSTDRLFPATDDRPFFHQRRGLFDLSTADFAGVFSSKSRARMALEDQPFAEVSLFLLLAQTVVFGGALLFLPVALIVRRASLKRYATTALYYGALGFGFMLIEIGLLQRLSLVLGRPALTFATVFAGVLLGAGLGSQLSARLSKPRAVVWGAAALAILLALISGPIASVLIAMGTAARVLFGAILTIGAGLCLGAPFPQGLLKSAQPPQARLVPWAFAVNGIASIAGTALALVFSAELGINANFGIAAACYAAAAMAFGRL